MNVTKEITALTSNPDFLAAYDKWRVDPVTERMLAMAKEATRPPGLAKITGEDALYYSGMFDACDGFLEFVLDLRGYMDKRRQVTEAARLNLPTTYGATMPKNSARKATT